MKCPWCSFDGPIRALHAHLAEHHPDGIGTLEQNDSTFYEVRCPRCDASYRQRVKKSRRDPGFADEFDREIRMVGFDMLINHLLAEHESSDAYENQEGGV